MTVSCGTTAYRSVNRLFSVLIMVGHNGSIIEIDSENVYCVLGTKNQHLCISTDGRVKQTKTKTTLSASTIKLKITKESYCKPEFILFLQTR